MAERLLIVEDEETLAQSLKRVFQRDNYEVDAVGSAEAALEALDSGLYDLIITDIILPGMDGIELLKKVKENYPDQAVIIVTAYGSLETAVEAMRAGAYDYVVKPLIHEELKQVARNALRQKALQKENLFLRRQIERQYDFGKIIGQSPGIQKIIAEVKKIADSRSNVLLLGETGTGKELFARAIHFSSKRAEMPFIPINCSAIPDSLMESEFFGHVKGAFTGAAGPKKGLFEEASGGTVFLDEIGELSMGLQSKLLRVLEDQELRPLGGTKSTKVDLRFISATNADIEKAVKEGKFREDLFYRINVITLKLPPLRERKEDIGLLVGHLTQKYSAELGKNITGIDDRAMEVLLGYEWPGNIRELQNIIERAILISDDGQIRLEHLPEGMREKETVFTESLSKKLSIEDYTKAFIRSYQGRHNEQELADMLGITRKTLWEKRKKWGISRQ